MALSLLLSRVTQEVCVMCVCVETLDRVKLSYGSMDELVLFY